MLYYILLNLNANPTLYILYGSTVYVQYDTTVCLGQYSNKPRHLHCIQYFETYNYTIYTVINNLKENTLN